MQTLHSDNAEQCARAIVERIGPDIRVATPIGIGKPVLLLNALYRLCAADPSLKLSIFTGLTLTRPRYGNELERRFVEPMLKRMFGSYPEPIYVAAQRQNALPPNITVHEFFLQAGVWLGNYTVQSSYICLSYAHVARHLQRVGTNVFLQLVAPPRPGGDRVSLSSNPDVTLDLFDYIGARRTNNEPVVIACEHNSHLPYMPGEAEIAQSAFDVVLMPKESYALFAPPKEPVSLADYAMGLHAATLIKDGGMLQIGIGSFSDALAHALILRHTRNAEFQELVRLLGQPHPAAQLAPFETGLYGCTEMLVDAYLALKRAGILKRRVTGPDGRSAILHAGFFVGNERFYRELSEMPDAERAEIVMTAISFTNTMDGDAARKRRERVDARFINTAMVATLLGAVSSDALADGRVVSGVGGQLDLVEVAHQLDDARAIIAVRSTRRSQRRTVSNIVWSYANTTVPRSLRDIIISEYGIADLRGRSDRDTAIAMLGICDTRFQEGLAEEARAAGKLEPGFKLAASNNRFERLQGILGPARRSGLLPPFPLGSDMTALEQSLVGPMGALKGTSYAGLLQMALAGAKAAASSDEGERAVLARLGLDRPATLSERMLRLLVRGAWRRRAQ